MRTTSDAMAQEILGARFATTYEPNLSDDACIRQVEDLDVEQQAD